MSTNNSKTVINQLRKARAAGVPFIAFETPDGFAAVNRISSALKAETPMIQWDNIQGWTGVNAVGELLLNGKKATSTTPEIPSIWESGNSETNPLYGMDASATIALVNCLMLAKHLPKVTKENGVLTPGCVLFLHNVHEYLAQADVNQAILLLREAYRSTNRTLVMVAPEFRFSLQLDKHVHRLIDPLPTTEEIETMVTQMATNSGIELDDDLKGRVREALMGLPSFSSTQALALAMNKKTKTINVTEVWERKEQMIRDTPGLRLSTNRVEFADVKGVARARWFSEKLMNGPERPDLVVVFDEAEKGFAHGSGQNDGGIGKGFVGYIATEFEENDWGGVTHFGLSGCGKSFLVKAVATALNVPCIFVDLKGMQGGIIGQSEGNLRRAFAAIKAMTAGNPLMYMTSNDLDPIPMEIKGRFGYGTFFFDQPELEERNQQFELGVCRYGLTEEQADFNSFDHSNWVGREVIKCCKVARVTGMKLSEVAGNISPMIVAEADKIRSIRMQAAKAHHLNANKPGFYTMPSEQATQSRREMVLGGNESGEALVVAEDEI